MVKLLPIETGWIVERQRRAAPSCRHSVLRLLGRVTDETGILFWHKSTGQLGHGNLAGKLRKQIPLQAEQD